MEIDVASEFRYRDVPFDPGNLAIFVSQSGETADTLASLEFAKARGQRVLSVVNVPSSTMARASQIVFPTLAGPEVGVASTKAFTCQLATLACLAIAAGRDRGVLSADDEWRWYGRSPMFQSTYVCARTGTEDSSARSQDSSVPQRVRYRPRDQLPACAGGRSSSK